MIDLLFSQKQGKTILKDVYYKAPFKITRLYYPRETDLAHLIIMCITPGLFSGDEVEIRIEVEKGARVLITSQSSQKIHPAKEKPACQKTVIQVHSGGELHYFNDPFIPFADSWYQQEIRIQLAKTARFFYWDGFMAGRVLREERWLFRAIESETLVHVEGNLAYLDRFQLKPKEKNPFIMGNQDYLAAMLAFDSRIDQKKEEEFLKTLAGEVVPQNLGFSHLGGGLMAGRFATEQGALWRKMQASFVKSVFQNLIGETCPDLRKI